MSNYHSQRRDSRGTTSFSSSRRRPTRKSNHKTYIDPSKFVQSARPAEQLEYKPEHKFSDFKMNQIIQSNLRALGFTEPSPIQDQTIEPGLLGKDIVGIANTGTGKTAAFAIPVINRLIDERNSTALILAPTRELAQQINQQFSQLSRGSHIFSAVLIGGMPISAQLRSLRSRPRLIIGTPGRIKDHLERRTLDLRNCNMLVIDEVDRMLDMGFINDMSFVIQQTSSTRQSFYFSATLDKRVRTIIDTFSKDPVQISVKSGETSHNVEQNVVAYNSAAEKIDKLHNILISDETRKTLVFDDTHRSVEKLTSELEARGFSVESIHGGKSQSQRQRVLRRFKENQIKVLVATDVAARGLDVSDISHVINYSSPNTYEDYVHRIGRTGRAGKTGYALTFVDR
jgi:ATP-dependent RNA helicase RhlE